MFRTFVKLDFDFWRVALLKLSPFSLCGKMGNYVLIQINRNIASESIEIAYCLTKPIMSAQILKMYIA